MAISKKRLIWWVILIICLLMIPLIAMKFTNEVNWELSDFIIMGAILFGMAISYEVIAQKNIKKNYRIAFGLGLLGAFLLFWVNGAVGIIGTENQDANLLYGAVFVVGLVGAVISRFRPKGMSITLFVAALVQMLVPTIALLIWPPSTIPWTPSVVGVFLLSGFFALLFFMSGMLFRKAASDQQ